MNDGTALLAGVLAAPEDDAPRLAYADWLMENGQHERGTYIRFAHAGPYLASIEHDGASDTEWDLADDVWPNTGWPDSMTRLVGLKPDDRRGWAWVWRRGFVEEIACTVAEFLAHAGALFAAHPVVRVTLTDREPVDLGYGWGWHRGDPAAAPDYIPDELWHENGGELDDTRWVRANPEDCRRALNLRCVAYGRTLAGLPLRAPEPAGRAGVG